MSIPITFFTGDCFGKLQGEGPAFTCAAALCAALDACISITCLVIGILGAMATIVMSAAAAYSLIGISCAITLAWTATCIYGCTHPPA